MTQVLTRFPVWAGLMLLVPAAVVAWSAASGGPKPVFDAQCEAWDSAAAAAVAELVADRSPAVEQRLGDVVFRLRRARAYCRSGFIGLAQLDYRALLDGRYGGHAARGAQSTASASNR